MFFFGFGLGTYLFLYVQPQRYFQADNTDWRTFCALRKVRKLNIRRRTDPDPHQNVKDPQHC
jgi:hypothetical protein